MAVLGAFSFFAMWLAGVMITRLVRAGYTVSLGTGAFILAPVGDAPPRSDHRLLGTILCQLDGRRRYALEGSRLGGARRSKAERAPATGLRRRHMAIWARFGMISPPREA